MAEYYYLESENQIGPVTKGDLRALLEKGAVTPQTPVFRTGDKEWQTAHYYQELAVDRKMAPPSRATSPKATPPRSLPPENDSAPVAGVHPMHIRVRPPSSLPPANDSAPLPDLQRSHIARAIIIIGALIAGYFLFFYSATVGTDSHTEVNNIGLMLNRLLGSIVGMVTIVVGVILLVTDTKKPSK